MLIFLVFKVGGGLEDRMSSEVLLLMILWENKSKALMCPEIFLNESGDEIEGRWLETVFKAGKDLVGGLNAGGRSYLEWLPDF